MECHCPVHIRVIFDKMDNATAKIRTGALVAVNANRKDYSVLFGLLLLAGVSSTEYSIAWADIKNSKTVDKVESAAAIYEHLLERNLLTKYFPVRGFERRNVSVAFTLNCDGSVSNIYLTKPGFYLGSHKRSLMADLSVTNAVIHAAPFTKPPAELNCPVDLLASFAASDAGIRCFVSLHRTINSHAATSVEGDSGKSH